MSRVAGWPNGEMTLSQRIGLAAVLVIVPAALIVLAIAVSPDDVRSRTIIWGLSGTLVAGGLSLWAVLAYKGRPVSAEEAARFNPWSWRLVRTGLSALGVIYCLVLGAFAADVPDLAALILGLILGACGQLLLRLLILGE